MPVGGGVALGGTSVAVGSMVAVGTGVSVGAGVAVANSRVMIVAVMAGVLVGTFGAQSFWPTKMVEDEPRQFAFCNCDTVVRYSWLIL